MPFVSTMILASLRMTGEKARGATLDSNELVECLAELNGMMDSWSNERLLCYTIQTSTHALGTGTNSYTVGTNGTISGLGRPLKIVDPCFIRDSNGSDTPVTILDKEMYSMIVDKDAGNTVPKQLFYDGEFSATSTATLYVYPAPSASLTLHFSALKQMQNFSTVSVQAMFPPGYQLAIETNYAIRSALGQKEVSDDLRRAARDAKAAIMGTNLPAPVLSMDIGVVYGRRGNIFTGR